MDDELLEGMNTSEYINEILSKEATQNFLFAAQQLIDFLEIENPVEEVYKTMAHELLTEVYCAGLKLEQIELSSFRFDNETYREETELFLMNDIKTFNNKLFWNSFYEVVDPIIKEENFEKTPSRKISYRQEPVAISMFDYFRFVYEELKLELNKIYGLRSDEAIEDALWQLKWGFTNSWGCRCVGLIRVLHLMP